MNPLVPKRPANAHPAFDVFPGRGGDLDTTVVVFDPPNWDVGDTVTRLLSQQQQLCIEEPRLVLDAGYDLGHHATAHRFEAALRVAERVPE